SGESQARIVDLDSGEWSDIVRILPIGDSITLGVSELTISGGNESSPGAAELAGYREFLYDDLDGRGARVDYVGSFMNGPDTLFDKNHFGTGGRFADEVLDDILSTLSVTRPDAVLLIIGTNDVLQEADAQDTVPEQIAEIIDLVNLFQPSIELIIGAIPPMATGLGDVPGEGVNPSGVTFNERIDELNDAVQAVVATKAGEGKNVTFVDPNLGQSDLTGVVPGVDNGLHPNSTGYGKIADSFSSALRGQLPIDGGTLDGAEHSTGDFQNVIGSEGDDIITGDGAANSLSGGGGRDLISGLGGADILDGGADNDTLTGGGGADTFAFSDGDDVITDFVHGAGTDVIDFTGTDVVDLATFVGRASDVSGDVVYDDGVNTLTIEGTTVATFTADDFIFA
ncbi:MAG: GDSL-type esterase/lipase family protein, partial [Pseudomonadota bacterium]